MGRDIVYRNVGRGGGGGGYFGKEPGVGGGENGGPEVSYLTGLLWVWACTVTLAGE